MDHLPTTSNLLIPALALVGVAVVLLLVIGKLLGGHSAQQAPATDRASRPPERPESALSPPQPSSPPLTPPAGGGEAQDRDLQRELEDYLAGGHVIQAVKRYREVRGVSLREAKDAVDRLRAGQGLPQGLPPVARAAPAQAPAPSGSPAEDPELRDALARGKKILAIKRYRELTGCSLKEAKDAVEAM